MLSPPQRLSVLSKHDRRSPLRTFHDSASQRLNQHAGQHLPGAGLRPPDQHRPARGRPRARRPSRWTDELSWRAWSRSAPAGGAPRTTCSGCWWPASLAFFFKSDGKLGVRGDNLLSGQ